MNLDQLNRLGFDESEHIAFTEYYRVKCSCCEATVINGVPVHERGCRNEMHECKGCNELIPMNQRYCEECGG